MDSPLKDKIVTGIHNRESTGGIREARYRDTMNNRYDAVHMYGPSGKKTYTVSVLDILNTADILDQAHRHLSGKDFFKQQLQFQYQARKRIGNRQMVNRNRAVPDSANYRNIRPQTTHRRNNKQNEQESNRYAVPTSNIFDHLNW